MARKITIVDLSAVTDYSRDQLHGLLKKLPMYAEPAGSPRVARTYSRHDTLVISVAVRLEQKHGLQRAAIAAVIEQIYAELRGPRPTNAAPMLHISIDPPSATYLAERHIEGEGTVVALGPVFQRVDEYLDGDSVGNDPQSSLPFGLTLATRRQQK